MSQTRARAASGRPSLVFARASRQQEDSGAGSGGQHALRAERPAFINLLQESGASRWSAESLIRQRLARIQQGSATLPTSTSPSCAQ